VHIIRIFTETIRKFDQNIKELALSIYQPTLESISTHTVPDWYQDAKLGIFVHYGLFSVPGWAVVKEGDITQTLKKMGWRGHLRVNPYSEWYLNTLRIKGSPTQEYHNDNFGPDFSYDDFVSQFNEANAHWDPQAWAALFARIGANYVVLTSKHCESFPLWPTATPNPFKKEFRARRDIVGELTSAVRAHGMRMGLYYCGGFDWTFNTAPITSAADLGLSIPQCPEYIDYCTSHWHELIERYQPSVMWGDVGYPFKADVPALFASYYNSVPDGVINDRFYQVDPVPVKRLVRIPGMRALVDRILTKAFLEGKTSTPTVHSDFTTPEYSSNRVLTSKKWETCRGLGYSFGFNRNESAEHMITVDSLVQMFVDIVSKNGNLLLNVGPMADGTISELQIERLEGLGAWLTINGEAIFGTRPWHTAEGKTREEIGVRFTQKADALYAILMGTPHGNSVSLSGLQASPDMKASTFDMNVPLNWRQEDDGIIVSFPAPPQNGPALVLKLAPQPTLLAG
jgi:alpha-L-fucosidase